MESEEARTEWLRRTREQVPVTAFKQIG